VDPSESKVLLVLLTNNFLVGRRPLRSLLPIPGEGRSEVDRTRVTLEVLPPGSPAEVVERVARKRPLVVDDRTVVTPAVSEREGIEEEEEV